MQAGRALGPVPVDPTMSALARDALSLRRVGNRPLLLKHALDQQQPAMKRQTGLRARHEDLQVFSVSFDNPHPTRRSSLPSTASVTNVLAEYT